MCLVNGIEVALSLEPGVEFRAGECGGSTINIVLVVTNWEIDVVSIVPIDKVQYLLMKLNYCLEQETYHSGGPNDLAEQG